MSFIDELCDYLVKKQLIPSERVTELQNSICNSTIVDLETLEAMSPSDSVPWGQAPWDIPPYDPSKYPDLKTWIDSWILKKQTIKEPDDDVPDSPHDHRSGPKRNSANRKAIKAPALNDILPSIVPKDKLLVTLFRALATCKWNATPTWEEWCDAIELLFQLDSAALDTKMRKMLSSYSPRLKACIFDFIDFYERTRLLLPDMLEGYSGPSVSAFKALVADSQKTAFEFTKHNWMFTNRNLLLAYHASLVNNRLRPLFIAYVKETYPDEEDTSSSPSILSLILRSESLCRLFARTREDEAEDLLKEWLSKAVTLKQAFLAAHKADFSHYGDDDFYADNPHFLAYKAFCNDACKYALAACIFFEETNISPNMEAPENRQTLLYWCPAEIIPRLLQCGAEPGPKDYDGNLPLEDAIQSINYAYCYIYHNEYWKKRLILEGKRIEALISFARVQPNSFFYLSYLYSYFKDDWKLIHLAAQFASPGLAFYAYSNLQKLDDHHKTSIKRIAQNAIQQSLTNQNQTPFHLMYSRDNELVTGFFNSVFGSLNALFLRPNDTDSVFDRLINHQDNHKQTALHIQCTAFNEVIIELLIKFKAYVNVQDDEGNTPLHNVILACQKMRIDNASSFLFVQACRIISMLRNANANKSIKNNDGKTPLDLANELDANIAAEVLKCLKTV